VSLLSESGIARREFGLESLKLVVRRRGRRRVMVRSGAAVAVLLTCAAVSAVVMSRATHVERPVSLPTPEIAAANEPARPTAEVRSTTIALAGVSLIKTNPRLVKELAASPSVVVARVGDSELQQALREAGEPAGLVRIGKRVIVEAALDRGREGM
jgi:hypothetical protein